MILFFRTPTNSVIATECSKELNSEDIKKLCWLYSDATVETEDNLKGWFIGPRREMITPWSTNAVEITQNMGLQGIRRIEEYFPVKDENADHDPMLQRMYHGLDQKIFDVNIKPQPIIYIENLEEYNEQEGLALSREEMDYLLKVEKDLGRKLTQCFRIDRSCRKREWIIYIETKTDFLQIPLRLNCIVSSNVSNL